MLELWLIRHGETGWNKEQRWQGQTDVPLNETGMSQAQRLQPRLAGIDFDLIYASDLDRAYTTATTALPDGEITKDQRLRELHFGDFEGKTWGELEAEGLNSLREWATNPYEIQPPGGEHYRDMEKRVLDWYGQLPDTGRIAAVAHGGVLRALVYAITGIPTGSTWTFAFDNCSISIVQKSSRRTVLKSINDTAHLSSFQ